jgi:hypothetical protein
LSSKIPAKSFQTLTTANDLWGLNKISLSTLVWERRGGSIPPFSRNPQVIDRPAELLEKEPHRRSMQQRQRFLMVETPISKHEF